MSKGPIAIVSKGSITIVTVWFLLVMVTAVAAAEGNRTNGNTTSGYTTSGNTTSGNTTMGNTFDQVGPDSGIAYGVPDDMETAVRQALLLSAEVELARHQVIEAELSLTEAQLNQGLSSSPADLFQAEQGLHEARMGYIDVLNDVAYQVEEAAFQVMRQNELFVLRQVDLEQAERHLALAKARYEAGLISQLEYTEIEYRRDSAMWALHSTQHQVIEAGERFSLLVTGLSSLPTDVSIDWQPRLSPPTLTLDQAIHSARQMSPAIARAVRAAEAAQKRLDVAEKTFASPIELERANMERDRAKLKVMQAHSTVTQEVSQLYRTMEGLYSQIALKEQALDLAERRLDIVAARYQAGQVALLDVVTAEASSLQAKLDLTAAVWDYYAAHLQLMRRIGRAELPPLPEEIEDFISAWR